jgi:hypothetical protein
LGLMREEIGFSKARLQERLILELGMRVFCSWKSNLGAGSRSHPCRCARNAAWYWQPNDF